MGPFEDKGPHVVTQARWAVLVAREALLRLAQDSASTDRLGTKLQRVYTLARSQVGKRLLAERGVELLEAVDGDTLLPWRPHTRPPTCGDQAIPRPTPRMNLLNAAHAHAASDPAARPSTSRSALCGKAQRHGRVGDDLAAQATPSIRLRVSHSCTTRSSRPTTPRQNHAMPTSST